MKEVVDSLRLFTVDFLPSVLNVELTVSIK